MREEMPSIQELRENWTPNRNKIQEEIEEKYQPILHAKDREILSLKMDNEALRKELDMVWKMGIEKLTEERFKVRDLEERWGKLLRNE